MSQFGEIASPTHAGRSVVLPYSIALSMCLYMVNRKEGRGAYLVELCVAFDLFVSLCLSLCTVVLYTLDHNSHKPALRVGDMCLCLCAWEEVFGCGLIPSC